MTDAELGAAVRQRAAELSEELKERPELLYHIAMALLTLAQESNAGKLELSIPDATYKGKPSGNWRVVVEKVEA